MLGCGTRGAPVVVRLRRSTTGQARSVSYVIAVARKEGVSAYMGDGRNRWPAVHRLDRAHLYRLVLEKGSRRRSFTLLPNRACRWREIAEAIGRGLKVPTVSLSAEQAGEHFGWLGFFVGLDVPASQCADAGMAGLAVPTQTGLMDDLNRARDFSLKMPRSTRLLCNKQIAGSVS